MTSMCLYDLLYGYYELRDSFLEHAFLEEKLDREEFWELLKIYMPDLSVSQSIGPLFSLRSERSSWMILHIHFS
jgi:hypothetical protein